MELLPRALGQHAVHGALRGEGHEAEAPRPAAGPVEHHDGVLDLPVLPEVGDEVRVRAGAGEPANEDLLGGDLGQDRAPVLVARDGPLHVHGAPVDLVRVGQGRLDRGRLGEHHEGEAPRLLGDLVLHHRRLHDLAVLAEVPKEHGLGRGAGDAPDEELHAGLRQRLLQPALRAHLLGRASWSRRGCRVEVAVEGQRRRTSRAGPRRARGVGGGGSGRDSGGRARPPAPPPRPGGCFFLTWSGPGGGGRGSRGAGARPRGRSLGLGLGLRLRPLRRGWWLTPRARRGAPGPGRRGAGGGRGRGGIGPGLLGLGGSVPGHRASMR